MNISEFKMILTKLQAAQGANKALSFKLLKCDIDTIIDLLHNGFIKLRGSFEKPYVSITSKGSLTLQTL